MSQASYDEGVYRCDLRLILVSWVYFAEYRFIFLSPLVGSLFSINIYINILICQEYQFPPLPSLKKIDLSRTGNYFIIVFFLTLVFRIRIRPDLYKIGLLDPDPDSGALVSRQKIAELSF